MTVFYTLVASFSIMSAECNVACLRSRYDGGQIFKKDKTLCLCYDLLNYEKITYKKKRRLRLSKNVPQRPNYIYRDITKKSPD